MRMDDAVKKLFSSELNGSTSLDIPLCVDYSHGGADAMFVTEIFPDGSFRWQEFSGERSRADKFYSKSCKVRSVHLRRSVIKKVSLAFICDYMRYLG